MNLAEVIQLIIGSGGLFGVLLLIFRTGRIVERISSIEKSIYGLKDDIQEVRIDIKEIRNDISDLRERVAGIEMSTIFLQVNPNPPSRSDVAKKMWEKRRAKQVENK